MSAILRKHLTADASHTIHLVLPLEMGDEVDVIVIPRSTEKLTAKNLAEQQEHLAMAQLMDESGFSKNVLNSVEEDCWNDL
jgi:hypothetical protein